MKAKVDPEKCIGCGLCTSTAPEDFAMSPEGKSQPKSALVQDEAAVRRAVSDCPVTAISVVE